MGYRVSGGGFWWKEVSVHSGLEVRVRSVDFPGVCFFFQLKNSFGQRQVHQNGTWRRRKFENVAWGKKTHCRGEKR